MARFETEAAFGELVHVLQQLDRALEDAGEIEQRVRVERVLVHRRKATGKDPPHAARHDTVEIAAEIANLSRHQRRKLERGGAMTLQASGVSQSLTEKPVPANLSPRGFPSWVRKYARRRSISARNAAWPSRVSSAGVRRAECGVRIRLAQLPKIAGQHRELRMVDGTVVQEDVEAIAHAGEQIAQPGRR